MAFTDTRVDYRNLESYDERLNAYGFQKGIEDDVTYGLDVVGTTITSGTFVNGGAFGILGRKGESETFSEIGMTSNYSGYLTIHTHFDGKYSDSELLAEGTRRFNDRFSSGADKYFTIYRFSGGKPIEDYRKPWNVGDVQTLSEQKVFKLSELNIQDDNLTGVWDATWANVIIPNLPKQRPLIISDNLSAGGSFPNLTREFTGKTGYSSGTFIYQLPLNSAVPSYMRMMGNNSDYQDYQGDNWVTNIAKNGDFFRSSEDITHVAYQEAQGTYLEEGSEFTLIPPQSLNFTDFKEVEYIFSDHIAETGETRDNDFVSIKYYNDNKVIAEDGSLVNPMFKPVLATVPNSSNATGGSNANKRWNLDSSGLLTGLTVSSGPSHNSKLRSIVFRGGRIRFSQSTQSVNMLASSKQEDLQNGTAPEEIQIEYNKLFDPTIDEQDKVKPRQIVFAYLNENLESEE